MRGVWRACKRGLAKAGSSTAEGGQDLELIASYEHEGGETNPYAELLGDAMMGETFRFARQDYVEEAWRIVDPVLGEKAAPREYEPGTWGPPEADALVPGGWFLANDPRQTGGTVRCVPPEGE